jgi:hypothetical protein
MNAQVTIGSTDDPHPSALLDLKSNIQGILLPQVVLGSGTILPNGGDKTAARGLLVFNTGNTLDGPGLYVWTGTMWQSVSTICTKPATPGTITFSPVLATNTIVQNTLITASVLATVGATSYVWTVPEDGFEIVGDATGRSVKIRAKATGETSASGITVKAVNDCGASDASVGEGTINVAGCTEAPAVPTLTVPRIQASLGGTFTLTCGDVGADYYTWTLPEGLAGGTDATNTTDNNWKTTANSIIVAASMEGFHTAELFSVTATNGCGTSEQGIGITGVITVEECEELPSDPYIAVLKVVRTIGATFTVSIVATSNGNTTYEWSVPQGLNIVIDNSACDWSYIHGNRECGHPGKYCF